MKYSSLIILILISGLKLTAQNNTNDSIIKTKSFYSTTNVRPVNIEKGNYLFSSQASFVKFYKVFNPKTGSIDKISDVLVYNEATFNLNAIYGISHKINLIVSVPIKDFHHYSPMNFSKGIGIGDIKIGGNYNILNNSTNAASIRLDAGFPTGKSNNLTVSDIPLGTGAFSAEISLAGMHSLKNTDFIYSAYYEYRSPNSAGLNVSDETGIFAFLQNNFATDYGNFGLEYGLHSYIQLPANNFSNNFTANIFLGASYAYNENLIIHFAVPYTVYQQNAFMTKYSAYLQFDYSLNRNKTQ